jgi:hydrogenase maturation protease
VTARRGAWEELERPAVDAVAIDGVSIRRGSRVRLHPRGSGDVWDRALEGRAGIVESIEQDVSSDDVIVTVTVEDDPGRDLGTRKQPGHRFFFTPPELEPLPADPSVAGARILVAGIGNVFLGDDGFGCALADRLARMALAPGIEVVDYGIRGMDLAYALLDGWDATVLLDAAPRGEGPPGTLYVIEASVDPGEVAVETHGMDPVKVLALVQALGGVPPRTIVVGCEPRTRMTGDEEEIVAELTEPVRAALDAAEVLVTDLLCELIAQATQEATP